MKQRLRSLRCIGLIAGHTFREAAHQGLILWLLVFVGLAAGGAWWVRSVEFGETGGRLLLDAGLGAQAFFGAVLAIVATPRLFFVELERRSVHTVLSRPVGRGEFMFGKLGGALLILLGFCAVTTALTLALMAARGAVVAPPGFGARAGGAPAGMFAAVAACGLAQWLKLSVLAAMTLFVASYAGSSLFATMAGSFALVACELQHLARDFYGLLESPVARAGARLLRLLLPDFQLFNLADRIGTGDGLPPTLLPEMAVYAGAYVAVFGLLAAYCFRHREL